MSGRVVTIRLRLLVALLLAIVIVGTVGYWSQQRIQTHQRWAIELGEEEQFRSHIFSASGLVFAPANDTTRRLWLKSELYYASDAVGNLGAIDQDHYTKLSTMWNALQNLAWNLDQYLNRLNSTQHTTLSTTLYRLATKFGEAYWNVFGNTGINAVNGPDFWYNGPAPPDETLLQQSIDLVNLPGLPPVPPA